MKDLSRNEIEMVSGGNPFALIGIALGMIYAADKLGDFIAGVLDGAGGLPPK